MRFAAAYLLVATLGWFAVAAPPEVQVVPPPEPKAWKAITAQAGRLVTLQAEPASTWEHVGDQPLDWRTFENGKFATVVGVAGKYRFTVRSPAGEVSQYEVTLTGDVVPPKPSDVLVKELHELYAAEPEATRKADMQALAALYTLMVSECADPSYATAANLNARFVEARDSMLSGKDKVVRLPLVRKRCGAEVAAAIGDNPDAALTPDSRKQVAAVFARLATAVTEAAK